MFCIMKHSIPFLMTSAAFTLAVLIESVCGGKGRRVIGLIENVGHDIVLTIFAAAFFIGYYVINYCSGHKLGYEFS